MNYSNNEELKQNLKMKERAGIAVAVGGIIASLVGIENAVEASRLATETNRDYSEYIRRDYNGRINLAVVKNIFVPFVGGLILSSGGIGYAMGKRYEQEVLKEN